VKSATQTNNAGADDIYFFRVGYRIGNHLKPKFVVAKFFFCPLVIKGYTAHIFLDQHYH
jgi:hypothetical protein